MTSITVTIKETMEYEITFEVLPQTPLHDLEDIIQEKLMDVNTHKNELKTVQAIAKTEVEI